MAHKDFQMPAPNIVYHITVVFHLWGAQIPRGVQNGPVLEKILG
jgi:hypothetical protein